MDVTSTKRQTFTPLHQDVAPLAIIKASSFSGRGAIAFAVGILAACYVLWLRTSGHANATDFTQFQVAARVLARGHDPYASFAASAARGTTWPLYYPLPAVLIGWLFSPLSSLAGHVLFVGIGAGLFTFAQLAVNRPWRLLAFASPAMLVALEMGQWSPLLTAAVTLPWLGFAFACKPTIGLALFTSRPSRTAFIAAATIVLVSLTVMPSWPLAWFRAIQDAPHVRSPITYLGGPIILLAALRWRRPEARVMLALAIVPQTFYEPDTLPLFLVAETRMECLVLAIGSGLARVASAAFLPAPDPSAHFTAFASSLAERAPFLIAGVYLPAVVMVLRRPNTPA
jgi:hypothetical protein